MVRALAPCQLMEQGSMLAQCLMWVEFVVGWLSVCSEVFSPGSLVFQIPIQAGYKTWDGSRKGLEGSVETPKLNKIRHYYNTLTWLENTGNHNSENLNFFKIFKKFSLTPLK